MHSKAKLCADRHWGWRSRSHLLIVDDPLKNDEQARSASARQKQWEWWQSTASTRLRPGGLIVIIQTRWHRDDLTGRILEQAAETGARWRQIKFPAMAEEHDVLGRKPGEALWPEMYTKERLERIKSTRTAYYWQSLYQQNPIAEGSCEWPESYFGPDIWFDEWPGEWQCHVLALDPSKGTESKFGDYSAFVRLMVGTDGVLYVDADLAIRNMADLVDTAVEFNRVLRPDAFSVEVNQFQQLLADTMLDRSRERGVLLPLWTINNTVNKQVRIRRLTPFLAQPDASDDSDFWFVLADQFGSGGRIAPANAREKVLKMPKRRHVRVGRGGTAIVGLTPRARKGWRSVAAGRAGLGQSSVSIEISGRESARMEPMRGESHRVATC